MITNKILPAQFKNFRQSSTIIHIKNYIDNFNGESNYSLIFNINYNNAVIKSLEKINNIKPSSFIEEEIIKEYKQSLQNTLKKKHTKNKNQNTYSKIHNFNKELIKGVKYLDALKTIHLYGFILNKTII